MNRAFCFWSHDEQYHAMAEFCAASFRRFGLHVNVMELPSHSDWMQNCLARVPVLHRLAVAFHGDSITMFDADLTCLSEPGDAKNFRAEQGDVCVHDKGVVISHNTRYCPGIISFAPTELGRLCLQKWADKCEADVTPKEYLREQVYLFQAIEELRPHGLRVMPLGNHYNDADCQSVIIHHVASRKMRDVVGGRM